MNSGDIKKLQTVKCDLASSNVSLSFPLQNGRKSSRSVDKGELVRRFHFQLFSCGFREKVKCVVKRRIKHGGRTMSISLWP